MPLHNLGSWRYLYCRWSFLSHTFRLSPFSDLNTDMLHYSYQIPPSYSKHHSYSIFQPTKTCCDILVISKNIFIIRIGYFTSIFFIRLISPYLDHIPNKCDYVSGIFCNVSPRSLGLSIHICTYLHLVVPMYILRVYLS